MNVTSFIENSGLGILTNNYDGAKQPVILRTKPFGCSIGTGYLNGSCLECTPGNYNDEIGGLCKPCPIGRAINWAIISPRIPISKVTGQYFESNFVTGSFYNNTFFYIWTTFKRFISNGFKWNSFSTSYTFIGSYYVFRLAVINPTRY